MSDVISTEFRLKLPDEKGEFGPCIDFMEAGLRAIEPTPYHRVLGRHFLSRVPELAEWLIEFHKKTASSGLELEALYVEMNGFTINPDQWYCDLFGYKKAGDIWELEWLSACALKTQGSHL